MPLLNQVIPTLCWAGHHASSHWFELFSQPEPEAASNPREGVKQGYTLCDAEIGTARSGGGGDGVPALGAIQISTDLHIVSSPYSEDDELPEAVLGHITVNVVQGRNIKLQGTHGPALPSCFAMVAYEASGISFQHRTATERTTREPRWNQGCTIPFTQLKNGCNIKVYNDEGLENHLLFGSITVSLQEIYEATTATGTAVGRYKVVNTCQLTEEADPQSRWIGELKYDELVFVNQVVELEDDSLRGFVTLAREKGPAVAGWASLKPHLLVKHLGYKQADMPPMTSEEWYTLFGRSESGQLQRNGEVKLQRNGEVKLRISMALTDSKADPYTHLPRRQYQTHDGLRHAMQAAAVLRDVQVYDTLTDAQRIYSRDDPRSSKEHFEEECAHHAGHSVPDSAVAGSLPAGAFQLCVHLGACRNVPKMSSLLGEESAGEVSLSVSLEKNSDRLDSNVKQAAKGECHFEEQLLYAYVSSLDQTIDVVATVNDMEDAAKLAFPLCGEHGWWDSGRYNFGRRWHQLLPTAAKKVGGRRNALNQDMWLSEPLEVEVEISATPIDLQLPPRVIPVTVELSEEQEKLHAVWVAVDADGSGELDMEELGQVLEKMGQKADPAQLEVIYKQLDQDEDGDVDYEEFVEWWQIQKEKAHERARQQGGDGDQGSLELEDMLGASPKRVAKPKVEKGVVTEAEEEAEERRVFFDCLDLGKLDAFDGLLEQAKKQWLKLKQYELPLAEAKAVSMQIFVGLADANALQRAALSGRRRSLSEQKVPMQRTPNQ